MLARHFNWLIADSRSKIATLETLKDPNCDPAHKAWLVGLYRRVVSEAEKIQLQVITPELRTTCFKGHPQNLWVRI